MTAHGPVETPVYMPVGTQGTVKAISQRELHDLGFRIILGNTYHLHLRPTEERVRRAGGLHGFINWPHGILTDSGGFQVFSLEGLRKISEEGVVFQSHIDGSKHHFTPEGVMDIQFALGSDIMMAFDECPPGQAPREQVLAATERTHRWAARCKEHWSRRRETEPELYGELFGIVQGGVHLDLRTHSAEAISALDTPGVAIGGVSVGEPKEAMDAVVAHTAPLLPRHKPRYLMGVGTPVDLLDCVEQGIDMFDCVLPSRLGRNGSAYTSRGRINIKSSVYTDSFEPIDPECPEWCCTEHTGAYLRHLYKCDEILVSRVLSYHNLSFYGRLMQGIRDAIDQDRFLSFKREFMAKYSRSGE